MTGAPVRNTDNQRTLARPNLTAALRLSLRHLTFGVVWIPRWLNGSATSVSLRQCGIATVSCKSSQPLPVTRTLSPRIEA